MFTRLMFSRVGLLAVTLLAGLRSANGDDAVTFSVGSDDQVEIRINDQPFATWNYAADLPKPFLMPVRTAGGTIINRALNDASDPDHPHHKGLWVSIDEVNGHKFWNEDARIANRSVQITRSGESMGQLVVKNEWLHPETQAPQVTETTTISIYPNRLLVYDIVFTAEHGDVVFEDTKEGLLGFRVAPSMKERNGGRITASDGSTGESDCWGRAFPWIDYTGDVDGATVGIALMDHPDNPRPSRYHVRGYGLFAINPFGQQAYTRGKLDADPVHLADGESFRLRYGVYVHDGSTDDADVAGVWTQFRDTAAD